jgi:hypothetical protein
VAPMATQKPDQNQPGPAPKPALSEANGPVPARRSDALEAELAMLEAMLPPKADGSAQPAPVDPPKDREGTR